MLDKVSNYRYEFLRNFNDELWNICLHKRFYNSRLRVKKSFNFLFVVDEKISRNVNIGDDSWIIASLP